jgi:hypothetical protein
VLDRKGSEEGRKIIQPKDAKKMVDLVHAINLLKGQKVIPA